MPQKHRLTVYLAPKTMADLEHLARRQHRPKSMVAEAAIKGLLDEAAGGEGHGVFGRRLGRQAESLERIERTVGVSIEMLALFVRSWLTATPPIEDARRGAAQVRGRQKFAEFTEAVGRRLAEAPHFADAVMGAALAELEPESQQVEARRRARGGEDGSLHPAN